MLGRACCGVWLWYVLWMGNAIVEAILVMEISCLVVPGMEMEWKGGRGVEVVVYNVRRAFAISCNVFFVVRCYLLERIILSCSLL